MRLVSFLGMTVFCLFAMCCHANPNLLEKDWYITSINSMPIELINFPERKPTLKLTGDSRYSAWAGCNQIMGSYELDQDEITFSKAAMTMMACQNNMDFEQEFVKMLERVAFWSLEGEGHTLNLKTIDLEIIAVFDDSPSYLE